MNANITNSLNDADEYTYHAFNANDNSNKMISLYEKTVSDIYRCEKEEYDILHCYLNCKRDISL